MTRVPRLRCENIPHTIGFCGRARDRVKSDGGTMVTRIQDDQSDRFRPRLSRIALIVALLAALAGATHTFATVRGGPDWRMIGHDSTNTRSQPFEHTIGPANANHLAPKWVTTTTGDVSATPAVVDGAVYFGDFGGTLWKLDA